jgi:hypothetical protein
MIKLNDYWQYTVEIIEYLSRYDVQEKLNFS